MFLSAVNLCRSTIQNNTSHSRIKVQNEGKKIQQESKILYLSGQGSYWEGEILLKTIDTLC